jgi:High potential iron-sulfur protein
MMGLAGSRRRFLGRLLTACAIAPVALVWRDTARASDQALCQDPATLSLAQKRARRAIGYIEPSTDAAKNCGSCVFFAPSAKSGGCGTCQLLSGGPVIATGICNSFAPRSG